MTITGIIEDHRVDVGGIVGASRNGNAVEIAFSNSAVEDGGHTIVCIPADRLAVTLGDELTNWFLLSLTSSRVCKGERIESNDLIRIQEREVTYDDGKKGNRLELMFSDSDNETVVISMPEDEAILRLGKRLYGRLVERGEFSWLSLLQGINQAGN